MPSNEDFIIAQGLMYVREGILSGDWDKVCEGFNHISGEALEPFEEPKSRLDNIRDMMLSVETEEESHTEVKTKDVSTNWSALTIKQIQEELVLRFDVDLSNIECKLKKEWIALGQKLESETGKLGETVKTGQGKDGKDMVIISAPLNEAESQRNKQDAAGKIRLPANRRNTEVNNLEQEFTEDTTFRFNNSNTPPNFNRPDPDR